MGMVMGNAWGGEAQQCPGPKEVSSRAEQPFRQRVCNAFGLVWPVPVCDLHFSPVPSLPLAPAPGIGPLGTGEQRLHSSAQFPQESPRDFFLPFLGCVFWIVFSSIRVISTFSMTCIEEAPFICINHI